MAKPRQLAALLAPLLPELNCPEVAVTGLAQDSRKVRAGDCFIAVTGLETDGRHYVDAAIERGAVAVIQEATEAAGSRHGEISYAGEVVLINVQNLLHKMSLLGAVFYRRPSAKFGLTGITGTNGKTSSAQLLAQLHALAGSRAAMLGTMGFGRVDGAGQCQLKDTGMTTPDALRGQKIMAALRRQGAKQVAMEVSSHSLEQGRVAALQFDLALFTNISRDHLDYHGTMASYAKAKAKLFCFNSLKAAVINADDYYGRIFAAALVRAGKKVLCYSLSDSSVDFYCSDVHYRGDGIEFTLHSPYGQARLATALLGQFNLSNLLGVAAAASAGGISWEQLQQYLPQLAPVKGRMQLLHRAGVTAIIDYAHTPDALAKALAAVRQHCRGQLCCVFGCGGDRDRGKRPQMGAIVAAEADRAIVTSDNPRSESAEAIIDDIVPGCVAPAGREFALQREVDRRLAIERAIAEAADGDCILIAGKGHENYQEVNGQRQHFDDFEIASAALDQRQGQGLNGGQPCTP